MMLSHRILVLRNGSAVAEFARPWYDPKEIIQYAASAIGEEGGNGSA
jgi:hypothetical protein